MPVATSTIAALALVGGLGYQQHKAGKDAEKRAKKAITDFEPPPIPKYERPKMADAIKMQRARATGASGREGTIKTSPAGIPKPKPTGY